VVVNRHKCVARSSATIQRTQLSRSSSSILRRSLLRSDSGSPVVTMMQTAEPRTIYPGIHLPSVIRLLVYRHVPVRLQVTTRRNILMRDSYRCQYCGLKFHGSELTLDHVIPRSQGGRNSWENLVACCRKDNHRKADRTPEAAGMPLLRRPLPASVHTRRFILRSMGLEVNEWSRYLYADSEGDRRFAVRG